MMVPLDSKGDRFLIPCMLPDFVPEKVSLLCPSPQWMLRRSFLMGNGKTVPIGVMGKMIVNSMQWGCVVSVWKDGCVVSKDGIVYSVRRHSVQQKDPLCVVDGIHIVLSSCESFSMSSHLSFMHFRQSILNVLCEFYFVEHTEVIPLDSECTDWCTAAEVMCLPQNVHSVRSHCGVETTVDNLCCNDLRVEFLVKVIKAEHIQLGEELGKGAFGSVWKANLLSSCELESKSEGKEEELRSDSGTKESVRGEGIVKEAVGVKEVAVKILEKKNGGNALQQIELIVSTNWEIYLMSCINDVNVVRLEGICIENEFPWIVMELLRGGDLFTALTDPFSINKFLKSFHKKYLEISFGEKVTMKNAQRDEMDALQVCVDQFCSLSQSHSLNSQSLSSQTSQNSFDSISDTHSLSVSLLKFFKCAETYWEERTFETSKSFDGAVDEV